MEDEVDVISKIGVVGLGLVACVVLAPGDAVAQTGVSSRWDTAVMTGVFLGHPGRLDESDSSFDSWYNTGALAISVGRFLTPHLKAEGEVMISGEGERYVQRLVEVPGVTLIQPYPIGSNQFVRTNGVTAGLTWQFFENQWAHPFVFGGMAVDFDRVRVHTWRQSYLRGDPRIPGNEILLAPENTEDLGTSPEVRGVLGAGVKLYVTQRAFFKTDTRVHVGGHNSGHLSFRLGVGVDF